MWVAWVPPPERSLLGAFGPRFAAASALCWAICARAWPGTASSAGKQDGCVRRLCEVCDPHGHPGQLSRTCLQRLNHPLLLTMVSSVL